MMDPQKKIQEILDKCSEGAYIFRGESKKYETVSSGLYRQYCQADNDKSTNGSKPLIDNENFSILEVEKDIVEKLKKHIRIGALPIEVLTELQHYGGKTTLLDFSKDINIALFFACDGNFNQDGRVVLFETSELIKAKDIDYKKLDENKGKHIYTLISPTGKSPRVIVQKSIFVHISKGYLEENKYDIIEIERDLKKPLLEYLSKLHNIKTETIYNDIQGFIRDQHNYSNASIEFYRGTAYDEEKEYDEAIKHYNNAIERNPQFAEAYNNLGLANSALGKHEEAIKVYSEMIEINPLFASTYNNRGTANFARGQHEKAIEDFSEAIKLNPQNAKAYYNRGNVNSARKDHKEAIKDYNKAIKLNPQYGTAYYNRGVAKNTLGRYKKAIKDYNEAIKLNPHYVKAYLNRGGAKLVAGQHKEAIIDYNEAIKLNPQDATAYCLRGNTNFALGEHQEAMKDYIEAKKLYERQDNMEMAEECKKQIIHSKKLMDEQS